MKEKEIEEDREIYYVLYVINQTMRACVRICVK